MEGARGRMENGEQEEGVDGWMDGWIVGSRVGGR